MIVNQDMPVAIAGVMGGQNTEITDIGGLPRLAL